MAEGSTTDTAVSQAQAVSQTQASTAATQANTTAIDANNAASARAVTGNQAIAQSSIHTAEAINKQSSAISNATNKVNDYSKSLLSSDIVQKKLDNTLKSLGLSASAMGGPLSTLIKGWFAGDATLGKFTDSLDESSKSIANATEKLAGLAANVPIIGTVLEISQNFVHASNQAKAFENAVISAAMSTGALNVFSDQEFARFGEHMDAALEHMVYESEAQANLMGITVQEALSRQISIMAELPGQATRIFEVIENKGSTTMNAVELISQTTRGLGITFKEGADIARDAFGTFGISADDAMKRLASMYKVTQNTKIPIQDIKSAVSSVDESFKMWGTQIDSTTSLITQMSNALQNTGIGFKGQIELVKDLTNAIHGTNLAQKAFIGLTSGMTAGAGGMVGVGLQIEQMLQQGKVGDIVGMLQETIEKRTGRGAVTLTEAAESPEAQQAFLVQRGLLGQFGITDTGAQNRILEAMSKTQLSGEASVDAQEALKEALDRGEDLTQRQTNYAMLTAQNSGQIFDAVNSIRMYTDSRKVMGAGREERADVIRAARTEFREPEYEKRLGEFVTGEQKRKQKSDEAMAKAEMAISKTALEIGTKGKAIFEEYERGSTYEPSENLRRQAFGLRQSYNELMESQKALDKANAESAKRKIQHPHKLPRPIEVPERELAIPKESKEYSFKFEPVNIKVSVEQDGRPSINRNIEIIAEQVAKQATTTGKVL